jgi:hypothetical protein
MANLKKSTMIQDRLQQLEIEKAEIKKEMAEHFSTSNITTI